MQRAALILARIALAAVFLWAAYAKLRDPWMIFAMEIDAMHIVPGAAVEFLARTMPWFELLLGVLLVIGLQMRYVASVATALLGGFCDAAGFCICAGFRAIAGVLGRGSSWGRRRWHGMARCWHCQLG